ncbi:DoxX family protein [Streptomyces sp. TRM66268-LWL]|uniref:DoxX family protein n=1 Tax=Streptomyces polyasparticus TaxID=2767826 RepID=A0ABR7SQL6_9ACTN|nr:DoxX family protein [Streptomyces polyasparticus]MBC9717257.1 DoxX family protein [Streptomyces polyasparticus]
MNTALWIVTALLAAAFFFGGAGKIALAKDRIHAFGASAHWVEDFSERGVKGIGAVEVLAAFGLILPAVTDIAPVLVPVAAVGIMLLMTGAAVVRLRRGELKFMIADVVYFLLAAFVAWGRFGPEAF